MNRIEQLSLAGMSLALAVLSGLATGAEAAEIVHDAEYYILEVQNGERWAAEDEILDAKLAALR